jgi:hypothetical protein
VSPSHTVQADLFHFSPAEASSRIVLCQLLFSFVLVGDW